jgi:hypothetical protein
MKKILNPPNYVIAIILLLIATLMIFDFLTIDRSNVQSAQVIEIAIIPCKIIDDTQIRVLQFKEGDSPNICGKVLSEYLPIELEFELTNMQSNKRVYYEVGNISAYDFLIKLPEDLTIGEYEFEVKSGRRHFGTVTFEVME